MLPNNLRYMNKVESAPARQYTSTIQPLNGTSSYVQNTKFIINIPTSPNTVLVPSESFLKFKLGGVTVGTADSNSIRLDKCGAHGCIQRIKTTHGSTEIENIDNYGALVSLMMPLQQTTDSFAGKMNILAGTANSQYVTGSLTSGLGTVAGAVSTVTNTAMTGEISTVYAIGERINQTNALVAATTSVADRTYALNLLSYVGSLSGSQYIPLFEMTSAPLTLEVQLVSSALKFLMTDTALNATNSFYVSDIEFVGTFIELSDESIKTIRESQGGIPLQYVIQQYANVPGNIPAASSQFSLPVVAKYASLKSLFAIMRTNADGAVRRFPFSSEHYNLDYWRVRIGSQYLPAKAPNSIPEHFCELVKAIGSLSDINHEPTLNMGNYNQIGPSAVVESASQLSGSVRSNCFALGFDCETYSNSNKDKIFAGMNTLNSDIYWNFNFSVATPAGGIRVDFFSLYDQVIMFENGMTRVVK
jgi:hypothetical protein